MARRVQAKSVEGHAEARLARHCVAESLGQLRLSGAHVAGEDEQGRTILKQANDFCLLVVELLAPVSEAVRIEKKPRFLKQALLLLID
jgi:hypothetical protein